MTQNRALQLLYDLRYLNIVLTAKGEEVKGGRKQDSRYPRPGSQYGLFLVHVARSGSCQLAPLHSSCACFKQ